MVDAKRLRDMIDARQISISELAGRLGMNQATLYRRFSDTESFTIGEVTRIVEILSLSPAEAVAIFFSENVA